MTEELVTLETAKLLKEKGMFTDIEFPPQSIAQKWLREIRGVYVYVEPVIGKDGRFLFVISMFQQKKATGWRTK